MEDLDLRRLTGPNLLCNSPATVLDVRCRADEVPGIVDAWSGLVRPMLDMLGWNEEALFSRKMVGGVSLGFSAPIDALYAATEISEWAWTVMAAGDGEPPMGMKEKVAEIRVLIAEEANPPMLAMQSAAEKANVAFLWDDDDASIGLGAGSKAWPVRELPAADDLDWDTFTDVPVGIVTGTNGKTTTVRLATRIARTSGFRTGVSCTDWIAVDDRIIDRDDWSGPGGARNILRETDVDLAILETARGGLLRRGLGVTRANAALITNIAEDHLGDFGSQSIDELLDIKWIVSRAVEADGVLILNADDARLVEKARDYRGVVHWFSLDPLNGVVAKHRRSGGIAWLLGDNARLLCVEGEAEQDVCAAEDVPITLGGTARHNIANSLAAAALTSALGVPLVAIAKGLQSMTQDANPGRSNLYERDGVKVMIDFAHNPHAMKAVFGMATAMPAERRLLAFGQAGDRTDTQIRDLARGAWEIGLEQVAVSELPQYHRGRVHGEVFKLIRDELELCGATSGQIHHFDEEIDALDFALDWAQSGDLIIFLALGRAQELQERLSGY